MAQPPGHQDPIFPHHVCLLQKAIYGLKQAPRQWFNAFSSHLLKLSFKFSAADPSLLIQHTKSTQLYILIYVDDILITGNSTSAISATLKDLQVVFNLKVLSTIHHFLGLQVHSHPNGFLLSQSHYAAELLHKAGMASCKEISNPLPAKLPSATAPAQPLSDPSAFQIIVGALQYLTITRPDIQYSVNALCQHLQHPNTAHFQLLKRLLRYIKGMLHLALPIQPTDLTLHSFSGANWATDPDDRRSVSGHCSFLGSTLISWQVKKQPTVAQSSTEAEYRSMATAATDIVWLRRLLSDFQLPCTQPMILHCDNISAISLANNPVFHA